MKILILYDTDATDDRGVNWLSLILAKMDPSYEVETAQLDSSEIMPCIGCFGCWIKTPGACIIAKDKGNQLSKAYINADKVILLSKVTYGGYSPDTKAFFDRSLSLLSPFFTVDKGKMHHKKRYARYPDLIAFGYGDMTDEEKSTFYELFSRNVANLYPMKHIAYALTGQEEMEEAGRGLVGFLEER